jgi:hypothetical protein
MNKETRENIERINILNTKTELTENEWGELKRLCTIVFYPLLNEIERLKKLLKAKG